MSKRLLVRYALLYGVGAGGVATAGAFGAASALGYGYGPLAVGLFLTGTVVGAGLLGADHAGSDTVDNNAFVGVSSENAQGDVIGATDVPRRFALGLFFLGVGVYGFAMAAVLGAGS